MHWMMKQCCKCLPFTLLARPAFPPLIATLLRLPCRLEWDLQGWLGLSLRQLLFVLPPLCVALSQARLSPLGGAAMRVSAAAAAVAAWCSLHPEALGAAATSLHPWLRLSVVEALAALVLAGGLSSLLAAAQSGGWRLLRALLPAGVVARGGALRWAGAAAVCGGALVHPALAAYAGVLSLALQLAAASKLAGKGSDAGEQRGQEWLAFYGQLVLLPSAALYSWLAGGAGGELGRSDGRVLTALLALHAALGWCGSQEAQQAPAAPRRLAAAAVHEAAAATAAACCLWGHPFACMYAACASAVAQVLWG